MKYVSAFMVILAGLLILLDNPQTATAFIAFAIWCVVFEKAG